MPVLVPNSWNMSQDRLLGVGEEALAARGIEELPQAVGRYQFTLALAFCRIAGYRTELAWTRCENANTLLQGNIPGDRQKALSLLIESLTISSELHMHLLTERAVPTGFFRSLLEA